MKRLLRKLSLSKNERRLLDFGTRHLTPMSQTLPEDIFIAGYPKSGNSWFQDLVAGLVFGILPDKSHPKLVNDLVPDVHDDSFYRRYRNPTFFKTHHLPRPEYRRVVYLLRDGRDAMVSYWHHLKNLNRREIDFLQLVRTGHGLYPCKWHDHVAAWRENPHQAAMIAIKYEDLLSDPVAQMQRFCAFAEIDADLDYIRMIVERTSFAKLQTREKQLGETSEQWPKDKLFRRRGVAGSYRDEMPEVVQQAFMEEAEAELKTARYL